MTRMIERWFPCAEVSANSVNGWGSGNTERSLFTWFAARPTAQAKAAVICSLLPWPAEEEERRRLQELVRRAMLGRYEAWAEVRAEIGKAHASTPSVLDPFSGRGMIPLEAARLGLPASGLDYSPVAVLASALLADYPFRDWSTEPALPFGEGGAVQLDEHRLVSDVRRVFEETAHRHEVAMGEFYPRVGGRRPWGYLWAVTLPCQECGQRFPLVGKYQLRGGKQRKTKGGAVYPDEGQSFYVDADRATGEYEVVVHEGGPRRAPTLVNGVGPTGKKIPGKSAICPFCGHVHPLQVHRRLTNEGQGRDGLLVVADHDGTVGKTFRTPTPEELKAAEGATRALRAEPRFTPLVPALPDEEIGPGNNNIIGPSIYGARTYGDFMCDRQSLSFVRLARTIADMGEELRANGNSADYTRALTGYAAANMVRMIRYSTRGAWLRSGDSPHLAGIFVNEGSLSFSYDFFEAGIGDGPGTWRSMQRNSLATLQALMPSTPGRSAGVERGSATRLPYAGGSYDVVIADPPYDEMIAYADSSDLFFVWLKRALGTVWPEVAVTNEPTGAQEKSLEIIVKRTRGLSKSEFRDHRTREHYDARLAEAFREMRRVVSDEGIVTIVFGHGEPEVWQRLLFSIQQAGLVMTASWPANTESGGQQGKANIKTTLTMACRPAPAGRTTGRKGAVEAQIKAEIGRRYADWERWGLAPADMLMAAAGPAMEVVGGYSEVLDSKARPVGIHTFLPLARAAVQEAMAVDVDHQPLEAFDARTRFALWWVRLYGRQTQAKSELRWQALASSMGLEDVRDLVPSAEKGVAFASTKGFGAHITDESPVIDVALALAAASEDSVARMGEVLAASGRGAEDALLWAAVTFLADKLPASDPDAIAFARVLRAREGIFHASERAAAAGDGEQRRRRAEEYQLRLL